MNMHEGALRAASLLLKAWPEVDAHMDIETAHRVGDVIEGRTLEQFGTDFRLNQEGVEDGVKRLLAEIGTPPAITAPLPLVDNSVRRYLGGVWVRVTMDPGFVRYRLDVLFAR